MKTISMIIGVMLTVMLGMSSAVASVISSENIIQQQQGIYTTQQIMALVDTAEVQQKLITLGVDPEDAKTRIASMTNEELTAFHTQLNDMPAASGVVGTIVTVLVVLAVLDLMGVTDVYSFIRPIN